MSESTGGGGAPSAPSSGSTGSTGSSGPNAGSTLTGKTFSQSSSPTQGLQGYDLARRILRRDPHAERLHWAERTAKRT